jgi:hypothetical protein
MLVTSESEKTENNQIARASTFEGTSQRLAAYYFPVTKATYCVHP